MFETIFSFVHLITKAVKFYTPLAQTLLDLQCPYLYMLYVTSPKRLE